MEYRLSLKRTLLSACLAASMSLIPASLPAFAEDEYLDLPEWAINDESYEESGSSDGQQLTAQSDYPSSFDLRTDANGSATGLVSPVKQQMPWINIGAFGGTAAAEAAILSSTGTSSIDLSEKHMTYFGLRPVTAEEDAAQEGEGLYPLDGAQGTNYAFEKGFQNTYLTTLFSQGLGLVSEDVTDSTGAHPYAYWGKEANFFENYWYSDTDDWSIADKDENGELNRLHNDGYVLTDGNVLPAYRDDNGNNEAGVSAIKQELNSGRAVSVRIYDGEVAHDTSYLKLDTWAQYVYEDKAANQTVCIVGWDDAYPVANFNAEHQPPADGAWIVKGSWGSQTDAGYDANNNYSNLSEWGIVDADGEHTGYFYLSYYDLSICAAESVTVANTYASNDTFTINQHDYMPASEFYTTPASVNSVTSSANVFTADEAQKLVSVSTRTAEDNMHVVFAIYQLDSDSANPADGIRKYQFSRDFERSGFHRTDLKTPVTFNKGDRYAIISTAYVRVSENPREYRYSVNAAQGCTGEFASVMNHNFYARAVVNQGESFLYRSGSWTDWNTYLSGLTLEDGVSPYLQRYQVDNFGIKAYTVVLERDLDHTDGVAATCTKSGNIEYWRDRTTGKYYTCTDGYYSEISPSSLTIAALGHSWDGGVITRQATSTKAGIRTYTCTRCGATYVEYITPKKATPSSSSSSPSSTSRASSTTSSSSTKSGENLPNTGDTVPLQAEWATGALALVILGLRQRHRAAA